MTSSRCHSESVYYSYGNPLPMEFGMDEEVITEPVDSSRARDSILVTIRFRSLIERECHRGDEIAWYADGDKIVRNEYNPATAYAFGIFISNYIFFTWFFLGN
ncbi:kinesin-like protein KIN-7D, mitochondrial [Glycine max]|uniref:kinesin-like protein KIN-7D, mitochondrial n=1 Tax=Glycine max TaxID=3847 RepID=UPI001B355C0E|nr:kinesin-like protein KIN-7D, mitochondrial [Glycine max]